MSTKKDLQDIIWRELLRDTAKLAAFLEKTDGEGLKGKFLKGYCDNRHIIAQVTGFMKLIEYMTDYELIPKFKHVPVYDNAPSHMKRAEGAPFLNHIKKKDGAGTALRRSTTWQGQEQRLVTPENKNKGVQRIGAERGHWDADGKRPASSDGSRPADKKSLNLDVMRSILALDDDFSYCPTILEDTVRQFNKTSKAEFDVFYLAKFWCVLAFIEQFWCDVKRVTRQKCDGTITGLKVHFPEALRTGCPIETLRKYNQHSLDRIQVLIEGGRGMDFGKFSGLVQKFKTHRNSEAMSKGFIPTVEVRKREAWGSVNHAKKTRNSV